MSGLFVGILSTPALSCICLIYRVESRVLGSNFLRPRTLRSGGTVLVPSVEYVPQSSSAAPIVSIDVVVNTNVLVFLADTCASLSSRNVNGRG